MRRRVATDAAVMLAAALVAALVTDVANATGPSVVVADFNVDLNVAAIATAAATLGLGAIAYVRLKAERPKIVAEIGEVTERRLKSALESAWEQVDRLEAELARATRREEWLEQRVDELERALRAAGIPVPSIPPPV